MSNQRSFFRRYAGWLILAALIATSLVLGLRPKAILVEVFHAEHAPLELSIREEGLTRLRHRYLISTPVAGYVQRLDWQVGQQVQRGQVLARLKPLPASVLDPRQRAQAEARLAGAQAALEGAREQAAAAKASAEFARLEAARKRSLQQQGFMAEEDLQRARSEELRQQALGEAARFNVAVAEYELEQARSALAYSAAEPEQEAHHEHTTVALSSPIDGVILQRYRESEGVLNPGMPLLEIGDPGALEVAVDLLSHDAVKLSPGVRVRLQAWGGETLEGHVRSIEPVGFTKVSALGVEEQRVWVVVDFDSPSEQWQRLGDAYRVEAEFLLWQGENILQVPSTSLFRYQQGWALFVVNGDRAERRLVSVGHDNGLRAEIVSGLTAGEAVVTHPDSELKDGVRVEVRQ